MYLLEVENYPPRINPGKGPEAGSTRWQALQPLTYQQAMEVEAQERPGMVAETLKRSWGDLALLYGN